MTQRESVVTVKGSALPSFPTAVYTEPFAVSVTASPVTAVSVAVVEDGWANICWTVIPTVMTITQSMIAMIVFLSIFSPMDLFSVPGKMEEELC